MDSVKWHERLYELLKNGLDNLEYDIYQNEAIYHFDYTGKNSNYSTRKRRFYTGMTETFLEKTADEIIKELSQECEKKINSPIKENFEFVYFFSQHKFELLEMSIYNIDQLAQVGS